MKGSGAGSQMSKGEGKGLPSQVRQQEGGGGARGCACGSHGRVEGWRFGTPSAELGGSATN